MWISVLVISFLIHAGVCRQKGVPDEQALYDKLFRKYDSSVRPVFNATNNVEVKFELSLVQLVDMVG